MKIALGLGGTKKATRGPGAVKFFVLAHIPPAEIGIGAWRIGTWGLEAWGLGLGGLVPRFWGSSKPTNLGLGLGCLGLRAWRHGAWGLDSWGLGLS